MLKTKEEKLLTFDYIEKIKRRRPKDVNAFETIKDLNKMKKEMEMNSNVQKVLGLGDSTAFVNQTKKAVADMAIDCQVDRLSKLFSRIKQPFAVTKAYPKTFNGEYLVLKQRNGKAMRWNETMTTPPDVVVVKLEQGLITIEIMKDRETIHKANLPVFPIEAIKRAKQAKDIAPNLNFYLGFKPEWQEEKLPLRDPILFAHLPKGKVWFEVASWDFEEDMELINKITGRE